MNVYRVFITTGARSAGPLPHRIVVAMDAAMAAQAMIEACPDLQLSDLKVVYACTAEPGVWVEEETQYW